MNTCKEILLSRKGIFIDGERLARLVCGINYEARGDNHMELDLTCYIVDDKGAIVVEGNEAATEVINYIWEFEE